MQGLHVFEPTTRTVIDRESFMPDDHLLRKVDRILEPAFIRKLTARCYAQGKGRPSIDPVVYFRVVLVKYLYGIDSDRRLCEEVYCNLAYRWFCRLSLKDEVPDHSSFSTIRDRYGEEIHEQVLTEIVKLCQQHGLVGETCRVMTDATLIPADAALDSLVHNDPEQARREAEALQGRTRAIEPPATRKISNQTHRSRTDPDATLAQKRGTPRQLKYKVHQSIDADSRVILDTHVTTGARHDNQPYLEQLQRIEERYQLTIVEATADRGYGSASIIHTLEAQDKQAFIPLWSGCVGNKKYLTSGLIYEKEQDRFRCPEGKYLNPNHAIIENHKRYVSSSADCHVCPQSSTCPARTRGPSPQRFVLRSLDQDLFEEVLTRPEQHCSIRAACQHTNFFNTPDRVSDTLPSVPKNGCTERSGTDPEVSAESDGCGGASTERWLRPSAGASTLRTQAQKCEFRIFPLYLAIDLAQARWQIRIEGCKTGPMTNPNESHRVLLASVVDWTFWRQGAIFMLTSRVEPAASAFG